MYIRKSTRCRLLSVLGLSSPSVTVDSVGFVAPPSPNPTELAIEYHTIEEHKSLRRHNPSHGDFEEGERG
jgi:hypothetical protein